MPSNVEIKARVHDLEALCRRAETVSGAPPTILHQHDTFFHAPVGRLKLRRLAPDRGELIVYTRPDHEGPKTSRYAIAPTSDPLAMERVLTEALGVRGRVVKTRYLFLVGRTRIHLDRVEGLGDFMELEVVLREGEDAAMGETEARDLMTRLGIAPDDLVSGAYLDLLA